MDELMKDNLEDHLSGMLAGKRKDEFASYLAKRPKAAWRGFRWPIMLSSVLIAL